MAKIKIENKSAAPLHGLKIGGQRDIDADENGTPLDKHWRRRMRDKSIVVIPETKKAIKKNKEES